MDSLTQAALGAAVGEAVLGRRLPGLRAVALGARGTLIGRAFLYGLGASGRAGVTRVLEILHKEMDLTMALCGRSNLSDVDETILLK